MISPDPVPEQDITIGEERTASSLNPSELSAVSNDSVTIAAIFPEIAVKVSGIYDFSVEIPENVKTGSKLLWYPFEREDTGSVNAAAEDEQGVWFYDEEGREITTVPESHKVNISAYLEGGKTYAPVLAAEFEENIPSPEPVSPVEPDNQDNTTSPVSSGGGVSITYLDCEAVYVCLHRFFCS